MKRSLIIILLILGFPSHALMVIAPTYKYERDWDSYFITVKVLNYDAGNTEPNPCRNYVPNSLDKCELQAFVSTPGKPDFRLWTTQWAAGSEEEIIALSKLKTLGRVLAGQRKNMYTNWEDSFPGGIPAGTCVRLVLVLKVGGDGPSVSPCAPIYAQVPGCALKPVDINIDFGSMRPGTSKEIERSLVLNCAGSSTATVRLSTLPDERLPLGSDGLAQVTFDWGEGYGNPGHFVVTGSQPINLRALVSSDSSASTGTRSGNVGVSISYW